MHNFGEYRYRASLPHWYLDGVVNRQKVFSHQVVLSPDVFISDGPKSHIDTLPYIRPLTKRTLFRYIILTC